MKWKSGKVFCCKRLTKNFCLPRSRSNHLANWALNCRCKTLSAFLCVFRKSQKSYKVKNCSKRGLWARRSFFDWILQNKQHQKLFVEQNCTVLKQKWNGWPLVNKKGYFLSQKIAKAFFAKILTDKNPKGENFEGDPLETKKIPRKKSKNEIFELCHSAEKCKRRTLSDFLKSILLQNIEPNEEGTVWCNPKNFRKSLIVPKKI